MAAATNQLDAAVTSVSTTVEHLKIRLVDFATEKGMDVVKAIIVVIVGIMVMRWVAKTLMRWLEKQQMEPPVRMLLVRVARILMLVLTFVTALQALNVPITPMLAGIGVAGVGIGLATQGVLSNLVAGLTIIFTKPFRVGEYVELASVHGQVKTIDIFTTKLMHPDLSMVVIPNRKIVGEILHNYGNMRQLDLSVGIGYGTNMKEALGLLQDILNSNPRVLKNPAPAVGITALSDCSINIAVKPWTSLADYGAAQAEIYQAILDRFRESRIEIPFPQREVRLLNNPS
ncbi:MAG TPA: mechanosensitive ion channel family protein [Verrucomicrobiae bacterium]|nr:mechanosensitive ion channel family protein [Verrucomicrobiae bacterium]